MSVVAGSDVLDEDGRDLFEPLDLGIGRCRMIVAERAEPPPGNGPAAGWDELGEARPGAPAGRHQVPAYDAPRTSSARASPPRSSSCRARSSSVR